MSEYIIIANCRGKKAVLNDIKNAYMTLSSVSVEFNSCQALTTLNDAKEKLWEVIDGSGYYINNKNRLIQKHL